MIQWATHHKDDAPPPEDDENREKNTNDISSWDQDFLKVDQGTLFELILVSLPRLSLRILIGHFLLSGSELSRYQRFTRCHLQDSREHDQRQSS